MKSFYEVMTILRITAVFALTLVFPVSLPAATTISVLSTKEKLLVEPRLDRYQTFMNATFAKDDIIPTSGSIRQEVQQVFHASNCLSPGKVLSKLNNEYPSGYIPKDLDTLLFPDPNKLPSFNKISGTSASAAVNTIYFARANDSAPQKSTLKSSESYGSTNPLSLIDSGSDSVIFTMDCSGYLTTVLSLGMSSLGGNDIQTAANSSLQAQYSLFVGQARITSPVAAAFFPSAAPKGAPPLSNRNRLDLLYAVANEVDLALPMASLNLHILTPREIKMLWTSNSGSSSFQGRASTSLNGNASLGLVSFKGSANGGNSLSREITYSTFNTYILDPEDSRDWPYMVLEDLHNTIMEMVAASVTSDPETLNAGWVKDHYEATLTDLNQKLCILKWAVSPVNKTVPGSVTAEWKSNACVMSFRPAVGAKPKSPVQVTVKGLTSKQNSLPLTIQLPIIGKPL